MFFVRCTKHFQFQKSYPILFMKSIYDIAKTYLSYFKAMKIFFLKLILENKPECKYTSLGNLRTTSGTLVLTGKKFEF